MKKLLLLLIAAAILMLSACQSVDNWLFEDVTPAPAPTPTAEVIPTPPPGPPVEKLFGVAWSGEQVIQPLTNNSRFDAEWLPLVYEGLFRLDASFQPQPVLCLYCATGDNMTFTLTLRAGVLFHDGTPLTAADVVWSLNTVKTASRPASPYAARLEDMVSAHALDDNRLEVVLSRPDPRFTALLTFPIVPAGSDKLDIAPGTGPYVPDIEDELPHLTPFDGWWQRKQLPLGRLELIPIPSGDQLVYAFESRKLSVAEYNPSDVTGVHFRGDYETWEYDTPILEYIGFNATRAPCSDPVMRRALAASVDRDAIGRDGAEQRWMTPAVMPIHPESPLYDAALGGAYEYDPALTASLLAELGYTDEDGDGVLEKTVGRRTTPLTLTMVVCVENARHVEAARRVADALTAVGVSVQLEELPQDAYFQALEKGDFDLYYGKAALTADFSPLPFFKDGSLGYGGYNDPQTLALWEDAASETLGSQARQAFWERFMEEAPIVTVAFQRQALLVQRGLVTEPQPLWENSFAGLPEWEMGG